MRVTTRRIVLVVFAVVATALIVGGCGGSDSNSSDNSPSTGTDAAVNGSATPESASSNQNVSDFKANAARRKSPSGAVDEIRAGTWNVGGAGKVTFRVKDNKLNLGKVRAARGWKRLIREDRTDEIEVQFRRGARKWKFEVEIDHNRMEISKELKINNANDGTYRIGSAARVRFSENKGKLKLRSVKRSKGWKIKKRDVESDDIEIDFRRSSTGKAEFEAEIGRKGLAVETSQKLTGPVPN